LINDRYFSLKETILNSEGTGQKLAKRGENIINNLNSDLKKLALVLGETHPLTIELRNKIEDIIREHTELNNKLNFSAGKSESIGNID
jgi:hypothetical protein